MPATIPKRARTDTQRGVRWIDPSVGIVECRECGHRWAVNVKSGGGLHRNWWRCPNGCNAHLRG